MARYGAMCGFRLNGLAIWCHQNRRHQSKRTKSLCDLVGLHIAIIVFARPDELARPLQRGRDHVIDQAMLVHNAKLFELVGKFGFVHFLEQVLKAAIIIFQDGVLGRQIHGPFAGYAIVQ